MKKYTCWARIARWIHGEQVSFNGYQCNQQRRGDGCVRWRACIRHACSVVLLCGAGLTGQAVAEPALDYLVEPTELSQPRFTHTLGGAYEDVAIYRVADDPRSAGCYCTYSLPNCQGPISGRVVDECYPQDGISLQENVLSAECGAISSTTYNCTEVMGQGARCRLLEVDCCGVMTQSAVCTMN